MGRIMENLENRQIYIKKYNNIIVDLPRFKPFDRGDGPYIIYTSATKSYQFVKFVYTLKYKKIRKKKKTKVIIKMGWLLTLVIQIV